MHQPIGVQLADAAEEIDDTDLEADEPDHPRGRDARTRVAAFDARMAARFPGFYDAARAGEDLEKVAACAAVGFVAGRRLGLDVFVLQARPLEERLRSLLVEHGQPPLDEERDANTFLKLGRGAVVELDRKVGEAIDIYVNDRLVARGEVVVVDDRLGITMTEIIKNQKA